MKFKQIFEARYVGEHPVIKEIKDAFNHQGFSSEFQTKFWDLKTKDVKGIVKSLITIFGEPRVGDVRNPEGNVYHWEPMFNDRRYGITIGHDDRLNTPYGIEIYYIGEPRKNFRPRR
ncbi:hypothetical protein LCGC14_2371900 [marine sediment metagenome]|uniref:Uncharacterized protein n=1 Tax=marine sediment metagenome TaxID=412755 RepID=A0A0F9EG05_9ZZZZ